MTQVMLIIISYNIIKQCQDALLKSAKYSVILIDNASRDGSAELVKAEYPDVEVVALPRNIGYGRAAIFSPAVKHVNFTKNGLEERKWISGSAMLFDLEEMQDIEFFDEQIFLFSEESDLCYRTLKTNKKILHSSDIYLKHLKGQACPSSPAIVALKGWHFGYSRAYFDAKHHMDHEKKSPYRKILNYQYKARVSFDKNQRLKYKSRVAGTKTFLAGEPAFDSTGIAAQSTSL
jgi:GT2 family glycosyltransferase